MGLVYKNAAGTKGISCNKNKDERSEVFKVRQKSLVGGGQFFRQDAGFAYYGDKVRISNPSGQNVHMKMLLDTSSGSPADIKSDIESVGAVFQAQSILAMPRQRNKFDQLFFGSFLQGGNMAVGDR
jgi:hypothetical protein